MRERFKSSEGRPNLLKDFQVREYIYGGPIFRTENGFSIDNSSRFRYISSGGSERLEEYLDKIITPILQSDPTIDLNGLIDRSQKIIEERYFGGRGVAIPLTGIDLLVAWRIQEGLVPEEKFNDPVFQKTLTLLEAWREPLPYRYR